MEWRSLEDFPDYQFSDTGLIKKKGILRSPFFRRGYAGTAVSNGSIRKQVMIHHVVAELFIGPRPEEMFVRHLDDNKENNNVSNLAYGTRSDNAQDAIRNGRMAIGERNGSKTHPERMSRGEKHGRSKLTKEQVNEIRTILFLNGSNTMLAKKFNVHVNTISNIKNGRTWL